MLGFTRTDGGRHDAGFKGSAGDCAVRAAAIALQQPYRQTYRELSDYMAEMTGGMDRTIRNGCGHAVFHRYLTDHDWLPFAFTGTAYMNDETIPTEGTVVCVLHRHFVTVINGRVYDSWDSRKDRRTKCGQPKLQGYYTRG